MVGAFVLAATLARLVNPTDYGAYFLALGVTAISTSISLFGIDKLIVRMVAVNSMRRDYVAAIRWIGTGMRFALLSGTIGGLAVWLLVPLVLGRALNLIELSAVSGLIAIWVWVSVLQQLVAETFRGLSDNRLVSIFSGIQQPGVLYTTIGCLTLVICRELGVMLDLTQILVIMVTSALVTTVLGLTVLFVRLRRWGGARLRELRSLPNLGRESVIRESLPLWIVSVTTVAATMTGLWLTRSVSPTDQVALFGMAQRVGSLLLAPMLVAIAVLPPMIARSHAAGEMKQLESIMRAMSGVLLIPAVVVGMTFAVVGQGLLGTLFGDFYRGAYPLALLLGAGQIINVGTGMWQVVLPMVGDRRRMVVTNFIYLATLIGPGYVLGLQFGALGVAWSYLLGQVLSNIVGVILVHRSVGVWTVATLRPSALRRAVCYAFNRPAPRGANIEGQA